MSKLSVRKFGVGVASLALVAGMGVSAQAAGVADDPGAATTRLSGSDRVATSVAVAKKQYAATATASTMYVVGYDAVVDAAVSGVLDAPVIIMPSSATAQELLGVQLNKDFPNVAKLVAIGGKGVVSDEAMTALKKQWTNITATDRLDGANRFETAIAVNKVKFSKASDVKGRMLLTREDNVVDALAAGALKDCPVMLVNRAGTVNAKVIEYYKSLGEPSVVVLGGEAALPDAQVAQLSPKLKNIDPWTHFASEPELKADVQKAAIVYLGQYQWESQTEDKGKLASYFAPVTLSGSALTAAGTNMTPKYGAPTGGNMLITGSTSATEANWFAGYKDNAKNTADLKSNMTAHVANLKRALTNEVDKAKVVTAGATLITTTDVTTAITTVGSGAPGSTNSAAHVAERLVTAFQDYSGIALTAGNYATYLVFDGAKFVDVNWAKISAAGKTDLDTQFPETGAPSGALVNKALATIATISTGAAPSAQSTNTFNWPAVEIALDKLIARSKKQADDAKTALDNAVKAYNELGVAKVVTTNGGGADRLAGADRYETAALLSYYAQVGNGSGSSWVSQGSATDNTRVILASGNDANLIDAVVAGQLLGGPVLLVPAKGDMPKSTGAEITRTAKVAGSSNPRTVTAVGGTAAIDDGLVVAAAKLIKDAIK